MADAAHLETAPGVLGQEAACAAADPPRSFSRFALTPQVPPDGTYQLQIIYFAIGCKTCGSDAFHLGAFPTTAPRGWDAADEAILRPPHRLKCAGCGDTQMLF